MGYYTKFELDVVPDEALETIRSAIAQRAYGGISPFFDHEGWPECGCKWYSWRDDCHAVSLEHPDVTFVVTGEGELGERWRSVWRGGTEVHQPLEDHPHEHSRRQHSADRKLLSSQSLIRRSRR